MTYILIGFKTDADSFRREIEDTADGEGNALTEPDGYAIKDTLGMIGQGFRNSTAGMDGYKIQDPAYVTVEGIGRVAVVGNEGALVAFFRQRFHRDLSPKTQRFIEQVRAGVASNAIGEPFSFGEIREMIALAAADMAGIVAEKDETEG